MSLVSSSPGTQWSFDPQGNRTIAYISVSDSHNTNSTSIETVGNNITDDGNNSGWSFDLDSPVVTLTALSPDPTSDNTPTLAGTVTDGVGTVSAVQFQIDSTVGTWSDCNANDGAFNAATESYACGVTAPLADGSHTMYIRATDSFTNSTSTGYVSDTFVIDTTAPIAVSLSDPGNNSYTSNDRPTFKWKAATDATSGIAKYILEVDNPTVGSSNTSGDFTIDSIPADGTQEYVTFKYVVRYENFSDTDSDNNYISLYTRSSSDWSKDSSSGENDGKLREGKVRWTVKAVDNTGIETTSSSSIFVDKTPPSTTLTQVNDKSVTSDTFSSNDKTITLVGKLSDPLTGGDTTINQDETGPRIAAGPKQLQITFEKKVGLLYELVSNYVINVDRSFWSCDQNEVIDNSKQLCDKYFPFEFSADQALEVGSYKIVVSGSDKVDNTAESTFYLNIVSLNQIATPDEIEAINEVVKELSPELQAEVIQTVEMTKSEPAHEATVLEKTESTFLSVISEIVSTLQGIYSAVGTGIFETAKAMTQGLVTIASKLPDFTEGILAFMSKRASATSKNIATLTLSIEKTTQSISHSIGNGFVKLGYLFIAEPTEIYNVNVVVISPTSVKISWKTNTVATGKVNYGLNETYALDIQSQEQVTDHEFTLRNLTPDTEYHFEVMSQGKNYVYDANRRFTTPSEVQ